MTKKPYNIHDKDKFQNLLGPTKEWSLYDFNRKTNTIQTLTTHTMHNNNNNNKLQKTHKINSNWEIKRQMKHNYTQMTK